MIFLLLSILFTYAAELGPVNVAYACTTAYGTDQQPVPKVVANYNVEFPLRIIPASARETELDWLTGELDHFIPHSVTSVDFEGRLEVFVLPYYRDYEGEIDEFAGLDITIRQRAQGVIVNELSRRLPRGKGVVTSDFIAFSHKLRAVQVTCHSSALPNAQSVVGSR